MREEQMLVLRNHGGVPERRGVESFQDPEQQQ